MRTGLLAVALRELDWLRHDRVALAVVLAIPLLAIAVRLATLSRICLRGASGLSTACRR